MNTPNRLKFKLHPEKEKDSKYIKTYKISKDNMES